MSRGRRHEGEQGTAGLGGAAEAGARGGPLTAAEQRLMIRCAGGPVALMDSTERRAAASLSARNLITWTEGGRVRRTLR